MRQLKFVNTTRASSWASHPLRRKTDKNVSVACGSSYNAYVSFNYFNDTGLFQLVCSCRYPHLRLQIWRPLWLQSGYPNIPEWDHHLLYPIHPSPDLPTPLIYYGPGGWGIFRVCSERVRLVSWGRGDCLTLFLTCNDEATFTAAKSVTSREELSVAVRKCFLGRGGYIIMHAQK